MSRKSEPASLHDHAAENLVFIRETMERASSFTAVPGWGGVIMGLAGLAAAIIAPLQRTSEAWLLTWIVTAVVASSTGIIAVLLKSRAAGIPFLSRPARQFALGFSPAIFAGALLTAALASTGRFDLLPGVWLLLYGSGVVTAGVFSVRIVPFMGLLFLFLGTVALFSTAEIGSICLGIGFGLLHIVFGAIIARGYGG